MSEAQRKRPLSRECGVHRKLSCRTDRRLRPCDASIRPALMDLRFDYAIENRCFRTPTSSEVQRKPQTQEVAFTGMCWRLRTGRS